MATGAHFENLTICPNFSLNKNDLKMEMIFFFFYEDPIILDYKMIMNKTLKEALLFCEGERRRD